MTIFAPIIPYGVEVTLRSMSIVPSVAVLTPASVLLHGDDYVRMYRQGPRPKTIFINGGLGDVDRPPKFIVALNAATKVEANYIYLPDTEHDSAKTLKATRQALSLYKVEQEDSEIPNTQLKTIGVPQGKNYEEYIDCANTMVDMGVDALGVSRGIRDIDRFRAQYVGGFRSLGVPVHILGFSDDLDEDIYLSQFPGVATISSAMPIWYGQQGRVLPNPWVHDAKPFGRRPKEFFQTDTVTTEVLANLFVVSSWVGDQIPVAV